ncbi:hypothetical protein BN6_49830 [Saccharothrix espanaensis DSM 44229]|uniref:Uncharacterized protein n=2 Tax=Saccharothrix espanaensis TaxID=103731 RepID=K0K3U0_SACES|nr:hypothetical protein BN6_49830 [Saccharothrix espanaensis DSM 44229]
MLWCIGVDVRRAGGGLRLTLFDMGGRRAGVRLSYGEAGSLVDTIRSVDGCEVRCASGWRLVRLPDGPDQGAWTCTTCDGPAGEAGRAAGYLMDRAITRRLADLLRAHMPDRMRPYPNAVRAEGSGAVSLV